MPVVLEVALTLNPNNQIAYLADFTSLEENTEYIITGTYLTYDTRFTFHGFFDITLTKPPVGVPGSSTTVPAEISTVPQAAPPPLPVRYPFSTKERLDASNLNIDFEFSPGATPPHSALGGSGMYKYWVDTSLTPAVLRQCRVARASATYVAGDWITIGTIDTVNGIYSPVGGLVDGGTITGSITINGSETITNNFSVGGNTTIGGTLNVTGSTTLGGPLTVNNSVYTAGPNAVFQFNDRTRAGHVWQLWAQDDTGHLDAYTPGGRQILVMNGTNGDLSITGNLYVPGNIASSNGISAVGPLSSVGSGSTGVYISDRNDGGYRYLIYGQGENLHFYNERHGWVLGYFDVNGSLQLRSNLNCNYVSTNGLGTGGTITGGYIVSTGDVHSNNSLTAGNSVSASGNISCSGSMWMWDVNSGGSVSTQYVNASQTVTANVHNANYVHSNGDVRADGGIYGGYIRSYGAVDSEHLWADNYVRAQYLFGGYGNAGCLGLWSSGSRVCFRWGGTAAGDMLYYRVDEAVDRNIVWGHTDICYLELAGGYATPTGVALVIHTGDGTLYGAPINGIASDARIKENIVPTKLDALSILQRVPVDEFDVKAEVAAWFKTIGEKLSDRQAAMADAAPVHVPIGFVTQHVQLHIPEAVTVLPGQIEVEGSPMPSDAQTLDMHNFIPYLVRAVQQLAARVEQLEA
jgi:hypothetical protein